MKTLTVTRLNRIEYSPFSTLFESGSSWGSDNLIAVSSVNSVSYLAD